tara:strand:+ start:187 stop:438 length:252 start_codon:yes stop_codon:yes gene_type:complete
METILIELLKKQGSENEVWLENLNDRLQHIKDMVSILARSEADGDKLDKVTEDVSELEYEVREIVGGREDNNQKIRNAINNLL